MEDLDAQIAAYRKQYGPDAAKERERAAADHKRSVVTALRRNALERAEQIKRENAAGVTRRKVVAPVYGPEGEDTTDAPDAGGFLGRVADRVGDTAISLVKGGAAVGDAAVGLGNLVSGGRAGQLAEQIGFDSRALGQELDKYLSDEQVKANREVEEATGFSGKASAMLENPSTIINAIAESAPGMAAGGLAGRGLGALGRLAKLRSSTAGLGGVGEGLIAAGSTAEQARQNTVDGTLSTHDAALAALNGIITGGMGASLGKLSTRMGFVDPDAMMVAAQKNPAVARYAAKAMQADAPRGVEMPFLSKAREAGFKQAGGALGEGIEEVTQGVPEALITDRINRQPDKIAPAPDLDLGGVVASSLLTGAGMGLGLPAARTALEAPQEALKNRFAPTRPAPEIVPPAASQEQEPTLGEVDEALPRLRAELATASEEERGGLESRISMVEAQGRKLRGEPEPAMAPAYLPTLTKPLDEQLDLGLGLEAPQTTVREEVNAPMEPEQPKRYVRFGDWHPSETSRNYATGRTEMGVSVYELRPDGSIVVPEESEWAEQDLRDRLKSDEPRHLVEGEEIAWGNDGEPLLKNIRKVGDWTPPATGTVFRETLQEPLTESAPAPLDSAGTAAVTEDVAASPASAQGDSVVREEVQEPMVAEYSASPEASQREQRPRGTPYEQGQIVPTELRRGRKRDLGGGVTMTTKGVGGKNLTREYARYDVKLPSGETFPLGLQMGYDNKLYVAWVGADGDVPAAAGPSVMRKIMRAVQQDFPTAEAILGDRVSGLHNKNMRRLGTQRTEVPLERLADPDYGAWQKEGKRQFIAREVLLEPEGKKVPLRRGKYQTGDRITPPLRRGHTRDLGLGMQMRTELVGPRLFGDVSPERVIYAINVDNEPLQLAVSFSGDTITVDWVGTQGSDINRAKGLIGPKRLRPILDALQEDFPQAQFIAGTRISGASKAAGQSQRAAEVPLNQLGKLDFASIKNGGEPSFIALEETQEPLQEEVTPEERDQVGRESRISTRLPTLPGATEDPIKENLLVGLKAFMALPPALLAKNVAIIREMKMLRIAPDATTKQVVETFVKHVAGNLLWLFNQIPEATRQRSKLWYVGANNLAHRWSKEYQTLPRQIAGVMAVLSPQKDWYQNVSLAQRILDIWTKEQDTPWSPEMEAIMSKVFPGQTREETNDIRKGDRTQEDVDAKVAERAAFAAALPRTALSEITDPWQQAQWVRVYDEAHNDRSFRLLTPEGEFGDFFRNKGKPAKPGKPSRELKTKGKGGVTRYSKEIPARPAQPGPPRSVAWGGFDSISKAIEILKDGSRENISANLGDEHKVRSFFNNIIDPFGPENDTTVDTHAVAAGLLLPLSGTSVEVEQSFGGSGSSSSGLNGSNGLYGLYVEAYQRAAKEYGLAREMQSITWEAVRGLFTAAFKKKDNKDAAYAIWSKYHQRKVSLEATRQAILKLAGGIARPTWESGEDVSDEDGSGVDEGELSLGGGADGAARGGSGSQPSGGVSGGVRETVNGPLSGGVGDSFGDEAPRPYGRTGRAGDREARVLGAPVRIVADFAPDSDYAAALTRGRTAPPMMELDANDPSSVRTFRRAITRSKNATPFGAAVYIYGAEEYAGMRLFVSPSGNTGFALKGNDIVSVFSMEKGGLAAHALAIAEGGRTLDAFDTVLPELYAENGMRVVSRIPWSDSEAPPGWSKETFAKYNKGEPDVVFMVYDPAYAGDVLGGEHVTDYGEAVQLQQSALPTGMVRETVNAPMEQDAPAFYSRLERAITSGPNKGTPGQWSAHLSKGTALGEREWTGINDFLAGKKPNDVISRDDVMEAFSKGAITVEFVDRGKGETSDLYENDYTIPGGEDYREVLIKLGTPADTDWQIKTVRELAQEMFGKKSSELTDDELDAVYDEQQRTRTPPVIQSSFTQSHFPGHKNVLAHLRLKTRTVNGEKVLHVEEIQSDWAQSGREKGFKSDPLDTEGWTAEEGDGDPASGPVWEVRNATGRWILGIPRETAPTAEAAIRRAALQSDRSENGSRVPDMPFKKTDDWSMLVMRKAIDIAVKEGFDRIAWTPGDVQNERFSLTNVADTITWDRSNGKLRATKDEDLTHQGIYTAEQLAGVIGKELADRLIEQAAAPKWELQAAPPNPAGRPMTIDVFTSREEAEAEERVYANRASNRKSNLTIVPSKSEQATLKGDQMKVGGKGMRAFYDEMLPKNIRQYAKRMGVELEIEPIAAYGGARVVSPADLVELADLPEAGNIGDSLLREAAKRMQEYDEPWREALEVASDRMAQNAVDDEWIDFIADQTKAVEAMIDAKETELANAPMQNLPSFKISPPLRDKVKREGQYLYEKPQTPQATQRVVEQIRSVLTPDLLKPEYRSRSKGKPPTWGHCYAAAEAAFHLLGGQGTGWRSYNIKHEGEQHWFLRHTETGELLDPTGDQFSTPVPYDKATGRGFLTKDPSARAREIISRVDAAAKPSAEEAQRLAQGEAKAAHGSLVKAGIAATALVKSVGTMAKIFASGKPTSAQRLADVKMAERRAFVPLTGHKVESLNQIAGLLHSTRDPKQEKMHVIGLDAEGKVVSHTMHTSGAINYVDIANSGDQGEAYIVDMIGTLKRAGAVSVVISHNHPSGDPRPSEDDHKFTMAMGQLLDGHGFGLLGQIVLNHRKATLIRPDITTNVKAGAGWDMFDIPNVPKGRDWANDFYENNQLFYEDDPAVMASYLADVAPETGLVVCYLDSQRRVVAVKPYKETSVKTMSKWLPAELKAHGALDAIVMANPSLARQIVGEAKGNQDTGGWARGIGDVIGLDANGDPQNAVSWLHRGLIKGPPYRGAAPAKPIRRLR